MPDIEQTEANQDRAETGRKLMEFFTTETQSESEPPPDILTDLLCNLMHMADYDIHLDFEECLRIARDHFNFETSDHE